jgi:hypothetical protein
VKVEATLRVNGDGFPQAILHLSVRGRGTKAVVTVRNPRRPGPVGMRVADDPGDPGPSDDDPRPSVRNPDPDALRPDAHRR